MSAVALLGAVESLLCARLRCFSAGYRTILLGTFFLTVVFDLMVAVEVGLVLANVNAQPLSLIQRSAFAAVLGEEAIAKSVGSGRAS